MNFREPLATPLIILTALLLVNACATDQQAPDELSDDRFAALLAQVIVLQDRYVGEPDSLDLHRSALFDSAGVTEQQIRDYIEGLAERPAAWLTILNQAESQIDSIKSTEADSASAGDADSTSVDTVPKAARYGIE